MLEVEILSIKGIEHAKKAMNICVDGNNPTPNLLNCVGSDWNSYHKSIFEHIIIRYKITASNGIITQLNRHKHVAISQMSTRYALHKMLKKQEMLEYPNDNTDIVAQEYNKLIQTIQKLSESGVSNDDLKPLIPQGLPTSVIYTQSLPDFANLIVKRLSRKAHKEARMIASFLLWELKISANKVAIVEEIIYKIVENIFNYRIEKVNSVFILFNKQGDIV
jgi:flavin-dependent thymidylate synthase